MRNLREIFRAALTLACWATATGAVCAQTGTPLITLTNSWKYYVTNASGPEGNWTATTYDDDFWPSGLPLFGEEDPAILPSPILTSIAAPASGGPTTVYFRTRFDYPWEVSPGMSLLVSNLLDDGAVYYLNGQEARRVRMPSSVIAFGTLAQNGPPKEGQTELVVLPATNLIQGENVLAVEVHQAPGSASDVLFGLTAHIPEPLRITRDLPAQIEGEEGKALTLSIDVEGSLPLFQWFRRNPGGSLFRVSTNSTYSFAPTTNTIFPGTEYFCRVTNILGSVTSRVATVTTIRQDLYPPGLLSAVVPISANSNRIEVKFTELLHPGSVTNLASYRVAAPGSTHSVVVSNVAYLGDTVVLIVGGSNWTWGADYILTVTGVGDIFRTNRISPLSNQVALAYILKPSGLSFNSTSLCWHAAAAASQLPPVSLPTNWMDPDLDESDPLWFPVTGIAYRLYPQQPPPSLCATFGSEIEYANRLPRYFRSHFSVPTNSGRGSLRLSYVIDDGAVFYLNGREVLRYNMPAGPIGSNSFAVSRVNAFCQMLEIDVENLRSGENVLAVEVHNTEDGIDTSIEHDICFGVEVTGEVQPSLPPPIVIPPPSLSITPAEADMIRLDWPGDTGLDWILETADRPAGGPWTPAATSPPFQTNLTLGTAQFFRLRIPPQL